MRINEIREKDRPYERCYYNGISSLRDTELLAILIQSGSRGKNSLQVAEELLYKIAEGDLAKLSSLSVQELREQEGIGLAKASRIAAAFELSKRINSCYEPSKIKFDSPKVIYEYVKGDLAFLESEKVMVLLLDVKLRLIQRLEIADGDISAVRLSIRELCRKALKVNASNIVLLHNHPSGDPRPSAQDISSTQSIVGVLRKIGLQLIDHIIVSRDGFSSIASTNRNIFTDLIE